MAPAASVLEATPTPFFSRRAPRCQQARLVLECTAPVARIHLSAATGEEQRVTEVTALPAGRSTHTVSVPALRAPGDMRFSAAAEGAGSELTLRWDPGRRWTIYLVPSSHVDLYSTLNARYTPTEHARALDTALDLARRYPEYRYQSETTLPIFEHLRLRPTRRDELFSLLREGRFAVGAQFTGVHQAQASGENLMQGQLGPLARLAERGVRADSAMTLDVPNATAQFAQMLADAGIRYWVYAPNTGYDHYADMGLPLVFRWSAPDGTSILATRTSAESYNGAQHTLGLGRGATLDRAKERIAARLAELEADPTYPYDALYALLSAGDNAAPREEPTAIARAWNAEYEWPRLRFGTNSSFLGHIEATHPEVVPHLDGDEIHDVWAFLVANQGPLGVWDRQASRQVLSAQRLAAALATRRISPYPHDDIAAVFDSTARTEAHDWFYGALPVPYTSLRLPLVSVPDLAKRRWARDGIERVRQVSAAGMAALASAGRGEGLHRFVVWNPCGWERTDLVTVALPAELAGAAITLVDDATGQEVPYQVLDAAAFADHVEPGAYSLRPPADRRGGRGRWLALVARTMAPLGYRFYRVERRAPTVAHPTSPGPVVDVGGATLDNRFFSLRLDAAAGGISSIVDKRSGRELVDPTRWQAGQMLVGSPETDPVWLLRVWWESLCAGSPGPFGRDVWKRFSARSLRRWRSFPATLAGGVTGPVLSSVLLAGRLGATGRSRRQAVILYHDLPRIDVVSTLHWWEPPRRPVRVVVAFPFAVEAFSARHDVPFAELTAGEGDAPTAPRTQRQLQTWVDFCGPLGGVTLACRDQGVFTWGRPDLNLVDDRDGEIPASAGVFPIVADSGAYSLVQLGRSQSRFSVVPHGPATGAPERYRAGWEANLPLSAAWVPPGTRAAGHLGAEGSFGAVDGPADVSALALSRDGKALVVRLVENAGSGGEVRFCAGDLSFATAHRSNALEERLEPVALDGAGLRVMLRPNQILTVRLELA
ncbi:MAG: hypothetical protein JJLCMIEE_01057 [Acidimicrobiales bacterium]|nr:hypothetical protein [Acidimicrobiales bacterium]